MNTLTMAQVTAIYDAQAIRYPLSVAQSLRTEVNAALQLSNPAPARNDGEDPDDHYLRQKKHGKDLWVETARLIAEAGL